MMLCMCMCVHETGTGFMALNSEIIYMPTYQDYVKYAKAKGFIPFTEKTFNAFIKAKINPISIDRLAGYVWNEKFGDKKQW